MRLPPHSTILPPSRRRETRWGVGVVRFPGEPRAEKTPDGYSLVGHDRPLRLSNLDKQFFADGYTKGDLIAYYALDCSGTASPSGGPRDRHGPVP